MWSRLLNLARLTPEPDARDVGESRRIWNISDALIAAALLYFSSVGSMFRLHLSSPTGDVSWPFDPWALAGFVIVVVGLAWLLFMTPDRIAVPTWVSWSFLAATLGFVVVHYLYFFPMWAKSSDSADALEVGVKLIFFQGLNPYGGVTWGGSPLSPMLGGFFLAAPFVVLLGSVFIRGVFWLFVAGGTLAKFAGVRAAAMFAFLAIATPVLRGALPNQSDHFVIPIMLSIFALLGYRAVTNASTSGAWNRIAFWGSSVLFGFALADRFIYWIIVVPLAVLFLRSGETRRALVWLATSAVCLVSLFVIPFFGNVNAYLNGPILSGLNKASGTGVPHTSLYVFAITATVVAVTSWFVRTMSGALGVTAIGIFTLMLATAAFHAPTEGFEGAFLISYPATAFNPAWLIFGLFSLALPRNTASATPVK